VPIILYNCAETGEEIKKVSSVSMVNMIFKQRQVTKENAKEKIKSKAHSLRLKLRTMF
jgi:hypothetical protein